jgi:hypothetical protein
MKCAYASSYQQRLDHLFEQVKSIPGDSELQSHWARYLCILVSGYIETSVIAIYIEYTKGKASPDVLNFVERRLLSQQNLNMDKIIQLVGTFNNKWAEDLSTATRGELKDAVDSIVANRNKIAHGENVGLSYVRLREWYKCVVKVIALIDGQCLK